MSALVERQAQNQKKLLAKRKLSDVVLRLRKKGTRINLQIDEDVISKAFSGQRASIEKVSAFVLRKYVADRKNYYRGVRDADGRIKKLGTKTPRMRGAMSVSLARFSTGKMFEAFCDFHGTASLPPKLEELILVLLGDDTFEKKVDKRYAQRARARSFAVAYPSASLSKIADYVGLSDEGRPAPNSIRTWLKKIAGKILEEMSDTEYCDQLASKIEVEVKGSNFNLPERNFPRVKGIEKILRSEMARRSAARATKKKSKKRAN